jgi:hypothetical protein
MTKPLEMKRQAIWFFIALIAFILTLVIPYFEGRSNSWWFPIGLLPSVLLLVSCSALFLFWIRSVAAKRNGVVTAVMPVAALLLFGASFVIRPADLFLLGFRDYAKNVLTLDEWRGISRFAQEHLPPDGRLPGPGKNLWNEKDHRALWSAFEAATQIQKLDPSLMIFVHPEQTEIVWGGALVGHHGVVISSNKNATEQNSRTSRSILIAEDITLEISAD